MSQRNVIRNNIAQAVDSALSRCRAEMESATREPANPALLRDLRSGLQSLELIHAELHGGPQRPKGQRSAMFTRYVIDEEPQMAMAPELRDLIVEIEDVYSRY
jgi:hypothetical protein